MVMKAYRLMGYNHPIQRDVGVVDRYVRLDLTTD